MKLALIIGLTAILGGCMMYTDPRTGALKATPGWQYVNPDSLVPAKHQ